MNFDFSINPAFDFDANRENPNFKAASALFDEVEAVSSPQINWKNLNEKANEKPLFTKPTVYNVGNERRFTSQYSDSIAMMANSSEFAPNEEYGQIELAAALSAMSGLEIEESMNVIKGGSLQLAKGMNYQKSNMTQTALDTYLTYFYRNRTGDAFTLYMADPSNEQARALADKYYEKSTMFKTAEKGNGWFTDNIVTRIAKTEGMSSGGKAGMAVIRIGGKALSVATGNPAWMKAADWLSKIWVGARAGSSQAGLQFYELSKEMDKNGLKLDMESPVTRGLFALDLFLMGGIEVGLMEWTPSYRLMTNILSPQAISQQFAVSAAKGLLRTGGEFALGVASEASEEWWGGIAEDALTNAVYAWSNSHNGTEFPIKNVQDIIIDSSKAFGTTLVDMIPTVAFSIAFGAGVQGLHYTKAANKQAFTFNPNVKQGVINSAYILGAEKIRKEAEAEQNKAKESGTEEKKDTAEPQTNKRVKVVQTANGGALATEEDAQTLKDLYKQNPGKANFDVIVEAVDINDMSSEDRASRLNMIGAIINGGQENGDVIGYADGALVVEDDEARNKVKEELSSFADMQASEGNSVVTPIVDGKATRIEIITKAEAEARKAEIQPVSTWQFQNMMRQTPSRMSSQEFLRQEEVQYAFKTLVQQVTGMTAEEVEDAFNNDVDSISMKLPAGTTWENLSASAMFMPIMSQITGRTTDDLLSEGSINIDVTGKMQFVDRESNRAMEYDEKTGKVRLTDENGNVTAEYGANDTKHVASAYASMDKTGKNGFTVHVNKNARVNDIVHELMHITRRLASPERLAGFVKAYGNEDLWLEDIKDNGDGTYAFNGQTYSAYADAENAARVNEEKFVEDFMQYLRDGSAPNAEIASFFGQLKDFFRRFVEQFRDNLSEDTVRAFDMLLNGEVDIQPGQTIEQALEDSERTLTDDVEDEFEQTATDYVDDENMYDEEGNPLYSLTNDTQWQTMDANTQRRIDADYEFTRNQYFGTDKWMKAPNGENTNLSEKQWVQVRTPSFKAWFGDWENDPDNASKMIDTNGEPIVFYHGSDSDFDTFEHSYIGTAHDSGFFGEGFYFAFHNFDSYHHNRDEASYYGPVVKAFFLNIRNPFDVRDVISGKGGSLFKSDVKAMLNVMKNFPEVDWGSPSFWKDGELQNYTREEMISLIESKWDFAEKHSRIIELESEHGKEYVLHIEKENPSYEWDVFSGSYEATREEVEKAKELTIDRYVREELGLYDVPYSIRSYMEGTNFTDVIKQRGFDGIVQSMAGDEAVVFKSNQIKSATDNNGAFSRDNNSILYSLAYHGSGASFDEFLESKIGTGTGTQHFGYGFYFTESDLIGKEYASGQSFSEQVRDSSIQEWTERQNSTQEAIIKYTAEMEQYDPSESDYKILDNTIYRLEMDKRKYERMINDFQNREIKRRNLYKVEIPDPIYANASKYSATNYIVWDRSYPVSDLSKLISNLKNLIENPDERSHFEQDYGLRDGSVTGENLYNAISMVLSGEDKASQFLADNGYVGIMYKAGQIFGLPDGANPDSWNYVIFPKNKNQIKMINHWEYDTDKEASALYSLSPEQETRALQELDSFPEAERNRISDNFKRLAGTPWHREAVKALVIRSEMRALMEGRELSEDAILNQTEYKQRLKSQIKALKGGIEGIFKHLEEASFISNPQKCVHAVNSSLLNCNPSLECALFCYASEGNYVYWQNVLKSEMITKAVEFDPVRAAGIITKQYKATTDYMVGKALRIFDKGDFSEQYVSLVKELNKNDIAVQVFSKRPEFLKQINNGINIAMLSIDKSNRFLADENPDLAIAMVYSGRVDVNFIEANAKRYEERGGVILPVKLGTKLLSQEELKALPQWARTKYTCPIDSGVKKLGEWNCQKCDINGTGGCFYKNTAENRKHRIYASISDMDVEAIDEATKEIQAILEKLGISPDSGEFRRIVENLHLHKSDKLEGIDPASEETGVRGNGEDSSSRDRDGELAVEENNRNVEEFAKSNNLSSSELYSLDGVLYAKSDPDYDYSEENLRSVKDGISKQLELFDGSDFSSQPDLPFDGESAAGNNRRFSRVLRPGLAKYFSFEKGWNGQEPTIPSINQQWNNLGYIDFTKIRITGASDIAKIWSIYRNPKAEYQHIVFTKGDEIVASLAFSSGLVGCTVASLSEDKAQSFEMLKERMVKYGADGYWLLHNHPSGGVNPSGADRAMTNDYKMAVPGFKGHIILDHNKYTLLKGPFDDETFTLPEGGFHETGNPLPSGAIEFGPNANPEYIALAYSHMRNSGTNIVFIGRHGNDCFIAPEMTIRYNKKGYAYNAYDIIDNPKAREATYAVIVTDSWARYKRVVDEYNKEGVKTVDDVIFVGASGVYYSAFENGDLTVQMTRPTGSRIFFQDTMFVYDKNRKIGLGIDAHAPVMETGNSTLFSLSPEKQSEILQSRKNEIQRAVEAGIFVSTEYLEEFRGEDWVESELDFRDWMKENADIVTMAREADSFEQFKTRYEKKDNSEEDADIPFSENGIFDTEEEQEKYEDWLRKIYHYANALSLQDRDRRFAEEWTSSEDKTLELAKYLRSYMDAAWNPKPKSRSGGYWYIKNVYNSFKGVSQKVRMLNDGKGRGVRNMLKQRSSSEEIKEAQELIRQNPRPYRNAYMQAMLGESRASDVQMGLRNIGESADWMKLDMIDDDIAQEIEKIESEETAKKASGVDYKTDSQTLVQKRNDAETDLKKSGESTSSTAKDLKDKLASAEQRIRELEADIKNAESEVDEIIGRMGERIEDLEEKAGKNAALKRQLADRRARVKELRSQLTAANKEKTRLSNALNALRRWKEAKDEMDYRRKRIRQIRRLATFNDASLDAMFEDTFDWVAALFDRDEADMDRRKDLDQRISDLKHEIERAETGGEDASQMREALRRLQNQKKQSRILEPPAQLQRYLPRNYSVRADNRPSLWTSQELDTLLKAVQLMRMDAKAILQDKKNQRMATLMGTAYSYFQQSLGYEAPYDDYGEMSARALGEEVANLPDKTFGTAKEKYLSYHLYKLKIQRLARIIDGYKEGVAYNWFVRRNWKCQTEELKGTNERLDLGEAKWKELELRRGDLSNEGFKGTKLNGTEYSLTRGQMIGVYVYAQSDLGYEKLTSVYGNAIRKEDVETITSQLSDKEKAWADFMLEEMQNNYPRLSKVYYNVWNRNLGQRPAYFPLVPSEARTIDQKDADFLCAQVNGKDGKANVDMGFTKDVNPNAIYPLKLDVTATWNQQVRRQEHFIAYGEWSRDTQYLMDRGQMGDTIAKAYGPQYRKTLQKMVDHVISNTITTGTDFDRTITKYFSARNAAALTASVSTALKQLGSIGAIFENEGDIGKLLVNENYLRNFLKANAELNAEYGDVKDVREFIYANAPDIRNRQIDFEVMAYLNRVYGGAVSNTIQQATGKIMKYTTNLMDRLVVERLWLARYYTEFEAQKEAGKTVRQAHEEAVFKASQLISETQPTSMRMDQSAQQIEAQKSSLLRMVSVFTNQAMNLSNMIMADWNYARKNRDWKKVVRVTSAVLINAISVALISGRFIKKGDEDDEKYRWRLAREILGTVAQLADPVWGGNLLQGLTSAFGGSNYLNEFTDLGSVIRVLTTPTDRKTAWEKIADALEDIAGEVLNVMGIPGSNLLRKPVKAIQEKNAGYLLNSAWGQIIESYR